MVPTIGVSTILTFIFVFQFLAFGLFLFFNCFSFYNMVSTIGVSAIPTLKFVFANLVFRSFSFAIVFLYNLVSKIGVLASVFGFFSFAIF